ncbi:MAG: hypothetical protein DRP42_06965 [Tenericutes bacterium]|nr:MAG: hypothetical protein DRP42_06965 [Mycoplasmatota bacterium]
MANLARGLLRGVQGGADSYNQSLKKQQDFNYGQMKDIIQMGRTTQLQKMKQSHDLSLMKERDKLATKREDTRQTFERDMVGTRQQAALDTESTVYQRGKDRKSTELRDSIATAMPFDSTTQTEDEWQRGIDKVISAMEASKYAGKRADPKLLTDAFMKLSDIALEQGLDGNEADAFINSKLTQVASLAGTKGFNLAKIIDPAGTVSREANKITQVLKAGNSLKDLNSIRKKLLAKAKGDQAAINVIEDAYTIESQKFSQGSGLLNNYNKVPELKDFGGAL